MAETKKQIVANPAAPEIFADGTTSVSVRGNVARMTFVSERAKAGGGETDTVVAGHLAMSVRGFLQLYGQMQSIVQQMQKSGLLKTPGTAKSAVATATPTAKPTAGPAPKKADKTAAKKPATKKKSAAKKKS